MPGDTQVTISWNTVPEATSYNIYWATTPGAIEATGNKVTLSSNSYTHAALVNGATYYYMVKAVNARRSAPSSQVSATPVLVTNAPSAPAGVSAAPANAQITISWNAVPGATSYNIYWSTRSNVTTASGTNITGALNPRWKQTAANKTAADLSAAPEYFNYGAYAKLFDASYPFTLPYSAGLDELRTYLRALNLPLWQLRQALLPVTRAGDESGFPSGATSAQVAAVAAERLGMTEHGRDLVTETDHVSAQIAWNTANPPTDLAQVPAFLQAANITYESLLELLQVAWVQGGLNVAIQGIDDTCTTSKQTLAPSPLDAGFLIVRIVFSGSGARRATGCGSSIFLLGAPAVANGTLDQQALAGLLSFRQLQDATGLAVDQQLAFYQNMTPPRTAIRMAPPPPRSIRKSSSTRP